jgi:large repetitive protein
VPEAVAGLVFALVAGLVTIGSAGAASGPILTKRPAVTGEATQGGRLVASSGSWSATGSLRYSYDWYRCDTMGRHCRILRGVHTRSHKPGTNDVGFTLSVAVRATDGSGSTTAFASLIGPIAGARPRIDSLSQPVVSGPAVQGSAVRVDAGRWRPKPSSLDYQWARCNAELRACAAISGETADKHAIGSADLGHILVAIVQARSGSSSRAVFSTASAVAVAAGGETGPTSTLTPAVAEVLQEGNQLTGSVGVWSGSGAIGYTYNWYRCDASGAHCKTIHGALKVTHTLGAKDVGHTLGFAVHAADKTGTTTAYASLIGPVAAASATFVSNGQPTISGTAAPGQTLQVSTGSWSQPPSALTYQWQRCNTNGRLCTPIGGATTSSYTPTADDTHHTLLAVVHATAGAAAQDAFSSATALVGAAPAAGPANSASPTVAGTIEQSSQLTGSVGTWSGSSAIAYTYNWYRCDASGAHCLSIHGATKATYVLGAKDVGHALGFAVHATDSTGSATAYATLVGPVAAANAGLAATVQPTITGNAAPGQALQVSSGSWSQPPSALTYQWQRCNSNGRLCTPITGATASSYTATAADSGHTLLVVVQASLSAGAQQAAALSAHTAVVS